MGSKDPLQDFINGVSLGRMAVDESRDRLICGLDFGTTYSGIAYAFSTKSDQIYSITEWPGAQGRSVPKAPTVLKYSSKDEFKWGYELEKSSEEKIVGIKLLLDPDQERPLFDSAGSIATKAELKKLGKPPIEVASDYIAAMYKHAMTKIAGTLPTEYFEMLEKQFVLSVPAVWSDKAKDTTMKAAKNAGITPLTLIKEPEAAALFTFRQLKNQGLSKGDAITICDAGGGTVDLVSYEVVELDPLELKELVPSSGGIAGSMMINRRFEEFVKNTVGERVHIDLKESDAWRRGMKTFDEQVKPGFRGREDDNQFVSFPMANIPDDPDRGIKGSTLTLTANDLFGIFDPVFREIDKLVAEQINKVRIKRLEENHAKGSKIKAIFLVGGFGSSLFLKDSIAKAHPDIQVIQPENAWSAIVQGAVLSKLPRQANVVSSVAESHYGVAAGTHYDVLRDSGHEEFVYRDEWEEVDRISQMTWYINKGDDLERTRSIGFPFITQLSMNPTKEELNVTYTLMMCTQDSAPGYPETDTVKTCCKLNIDLSEVPKEHYKTKKRVSDGQPYSVVTYKLLVKIEGARMIFSFQCADKEYGAVNAEY